ncbi:sensor histidine kinase [Shewanella khirikhana]|uniref:histidine kinase n=1 Tax=Shewanella khirikhana TaxID=1965282 RepID=A0ABM7DT39_9GAMM|nr:histidine kinase dimerization/phospho-acceptor domain-containing protein [Shewanella khirikhana]AZQ12878.1 Sensor protein BasS [Shewanella khirikhana]
MNANIEQKINRSFMIGAAVLLACYALLIEYGIHALENHLSGAFLQTVAPQLIDAYEHGALSPSDEAQIQLLPSLPAELAAQLPSSEPGLYNLHHPNIDVEFNVLVVSREAGHLYLVQRPDLFELEGWQDFLLDTLLIGGGAALLLLSSLYIRSTARRIGKPFGSLAQHLERGSLETGNEALQPIPLADDTHEYVALVNALNQSHARVKQALAREKNFTHYVSHEFRTPLTVLKLALGKMAQKDAPPMQRAQRAVQQMENLASVLLLLARKTEHKDGRCLLDEAFLAPLLERLATRRQSSAADFAMRVQPCELDAHPLLVSCLIENLLANAFIHSVGARVLLSVDTSGLLISNLGGETIDHGESHGIGLILVEDICKRYGWQFSIDMAPSEVVARVLFNKSMTDVDTSLT